MPSPIRGRWSGVSETPSEFNYRDLWYIKLRADGSKLPLEQWGGYGQNFEDADTVYSHDEVLESDWEYWGVCGIRNTRHTSRSLLIFDLDIHKAPAEFDPNRVTVPTDGAIVRSQSGGFHVYFALTNADRGDGNESDFTMTTDPGWDIDIRGSYVTQHVVAPANIPGIGGDYDLRNDRSITGTTDPGDAANRILLDGEPLLKHESTTGIGNFEFDRSAESPEDMPTCYHAGLELRAANPDDHPNTHKVNTLTALCGLAAGYSTNEMVQHFCEEFAPGANADERQTRYQLETMARKMDRDNLAPPSIRTLRDWGILENGETCDCGIEYHEESDADGRELVVELPEIYRPETSWGGLEAEASGRHFEPGNDNHDAPTIGELQQETQATIGRAMHRGSSVVVNAIMGAGKTYGSPAACGVPTRR